MPFYLRCKQVKIVYLGEKVIHYTNNPVTHTCCVYHHNDYDLFYLYYTDFLKSNTQQKRMMVISLLLQFSLVFIFPFLC